MTRPEALYLLPRLSLAIGLSWGLVWCVMMMPELVRGI